MSIKINIHQNLRHLTDDQDVVEVNGSTVGQCLAQLIERFPDIGGQLLGKNGKLLGHVDIYLNGEDTYPEELAKPVKDRDELHILLIITGG